MRLPKIIKFSDVFLRYILPNLVGEIHTEDDKFLIELNGVFSNSANALGIANMDRSGLLSQKFKYGNIRVPSFNEVSPSIEDVFATRANYIASLGRPVKFFWSGGIDSTAALAYLLDAFHNRAQLEVYYTCESVKECPDFIKEVMLRDIRIHLWSDRWEQKFDPDDLVVSGISADNITASLDSSFFEEYSEYITSPWQEFFAMRGKSADFIAKCEQLFAQGPVEIKTTMQARWWFYFYIRHSFWVALDWEKNLENYETGSAMCFFDCREFDNWSMHNTNNLIGTDFRSYKQAFKDALFKKWPNEEYRSNKTKVNSPLAIVWAKKRIAKFNQHYLFMYEDKHGNRKLFKTPQLPFLSKTEILAELNRIQDEI